MSDSIYEHILKYTGIHIRIYLQQSIDMSTYFCKVVTVTYVNEILCSLFHGVNISRLLHPNVDEKFPELKLIKFINISLQKQVQFHVSSSRATKLTKKAAFCGK